MLDSDAGQEDQTLKSDIELIVANNGGVDGWDELISELTRETDVAKQIQLAHAVADDIRVGKDYVKAMDTDGDGKISRAEYLANGEKEVMRNQVGWSNMSEADQQKRKDEDKDKRTEQFDKLDTDGNGLLDESELNAFNITAAINDQWELYQADMISNSKAPGSNSEGLEKDLKFLTTLCARDKDKLMDELDLCETFQGQVEKVQQKASAVRAKALNTEKPLNPARDQSPVCVCAPLASDKD